LLHTIIITTFENKKVGGLQTFKLCEKQEKSTKDWKVKPPPPPYLPNGEGLWWVFHTIGFRTFENGGLGHLQIPKKKL
jgi:hypothetical protein